MCQKICRSHLIYVLRICRPSALLAEHRPRNQNGIAFSKLEQRKFFIIMFHVDLRTRGSSFRQPRLKYHLGWRLPFLYDGLEHLECPVSHLADGLIHMSHSGFVNKKQVILLKTHYSNIFRYLQLESLGSLESAHTQ